MFVAEEKSLDECYMPQDLGLERKVVEYVLKGAETESMEESKAVEESPMSEFILVYNHTTAMARHVLSLKFQAVSALMESELQDEALDKAVTAFVDEKWGKWKDASTKWKHHSRIPEEQLSKEAISEDIRQMIRMVRGELDTMF